MMIAQAQEVEKVRALPIVSRFSLADIQERGPWLLARLTKKWPHLSEATFAGRIRAWIGSNSHYFTKTPHAIALFRVDRTELDPLPIVSEVFVVSDAPRQQNSEAERCAVAIYRDAARWARGLAATRLIITEYSDHGGGRMGNLVRAEEEIERFIKL